jgi:hypothetical protein
MRGAFLQRRSDAETNCLCIERKRHKMSSPGKKRWMGNRRVARSYKVACMQEALQSVNSIDISSQEQAITRSYGWPVAQSIMFNLLRGLKQCRNEG